MKRKWTKELCLKEAQKYKTLIDFIKKSPSAANAAYRHGWYKEYDFLKRKKEQSKYPRGYWTKERCEEEARKYSCRKEFADNANAAYQMALRKGWIDDYYWMTDRLNNIENRTGSNNVVYGYIFENERAIYVGRTNNIKRRDREHLYASDKTDSVIRFCKFNDIPLPEVIVFESNLSLEESMEKESYYVDLYKERGYSILNRAKCGKGSSSIGKIGLYKWTYQTCYTEAKKYEYAKDFQKSRSAYNVARKNGWLKDYTWLKPSRKDNYWNEITCREEAKKYTSRTSFRSSSPVACRIAYDKGWIDSYTWLIRPTVWNKGKRIK